jgi:hypothetical protein
METTCLPFGLDCLENWGMRLRAQLKVFEEVADALGSGLSYGMYYTFKPDLRDCDCGKVGNVIWMHQLALERILDHMGYSLT